MAVMHGRHQATQRFESDDDESSIDVSEIGGSEALQMICEYVSSALLQRCAVLSTEAYFHLVREIRKLREQVEMQVLRPDPAIADDALLAGAQLSNLLLGVSGSVSLLNETLHEGLLTQLLTIPLWGVPENVRLAALEVLLQMCHGHLVSLGIQALVSGLVPPPKGPLQAAPLSSGAGVAWNIDPKDASIQDSVLSALIKMMTLVPTAPTRTLALLVAKLPHKSRDTVSHCLALRASFAVAASPAGMNIRDELLAAVVDKLLELDVEIAWQDISERPDEEPEDELDRQADNDAEVEDMFELEGMTDLELNHDGPLQDKRHRGGWEGAHAAAEVPPAERTLADEQAAKLDAMMELTLEYLQSCVQAGTAASAWSTLLAALTRTLLPTQRSKFTQFLLFYLARQDPERRCGEVLRLLLERLADARAAPLTRSAAAAYAGSFLARAAFVPQSHLVATLQGLASWCLEYCLASELRLAAEAAATASQQLPSRTPQRAAPPTAVSPAEDALAVHQVFYSAFQALLYVMCYQLEDIMQPQLQPQLQPQPLSSPTVSSVGSHLPRDPRQSPADAVGDLFRTTMPRLLAHRLDPLSACNHTVMAEFTRLVGRLQLLPAAALRPALSPADAATAPRRPLQMFFPFDPYLLHHSARFLDLQETYVVWKRGHATTACNDSSVPAGGSDSASSSSSSEDGSQGDGGDSSASSSHDHDDEARSLPASEQQMPVRRSQSAAFRPIMSFAAGRRAVSAGCRARIGRPTLEHSLPDDLDDDCIHGSNQTGKHVFANGGMSPTWPHNSIGDGRQLQGSLGGNSSPATGSASMQGGTGPTGVSPWGRQQSYGSPPGGVMAMSWVPEVQLRGFHGPD